MDNQQIAAEKFKEGYNCAQSVLFSLSKYTDTSGSDAIKMATGFGAGMGRTQHICGAVSGGILALNLLYGRGDGESKAKQGDSYAKVLKLINKFEAQNNTVTCRELLDGCNLLTPEGQAKFKSENMNNRCEGYIKSVVEIVERIIDDSK